MKRFKFHKIGNKVASGWYCLIDSEVAYKTYLEYMGIRVAKNYIDIADSPVNKEGHCRTQEAGYHKTLLTMEMGRRGIEKMPMMDCLNYMVEVSTKAVINIFKENGKLYVGRNGSCRPSTTLLNCEEILEKTTSKRFAFPNTSKKDLKIQKWPGGNHFYVLENGNSIVIDGKGKWNTVNAAQNALDTYYRQIKYREN